MTINKPLEFLNRLIEPGCIHAFNMKRINLLFCYRRKVLHIYLFKSALLQEELERFWMDRLYMRRIQIEPVAHCVNTLNINGFNDEQPTWFEDPINHADDIQKFICREMFNDLSHENSVKSIVIHCGQVIKHVNSFNIKSFFPTKINHILIEVNAFDFDPILNKQLYKLASTATNIQNQFFALKIRQIEGLTFLNCGTRASKLLFKQKVIK